MKPSRFRLRQHAEDAKQIDQHNTLPQDDLPQKRTGFFSRRAGLPGTARLGFLGLIAAVMLITWPRDGAFSVTMALQKSPSHSNALLRRPLPEEDPAARVSPAGIPAIRVTRGPEIIPIDDEPEQDAPSDDFGEIIVVTPTPVPDAGADAPSLLTETTAVQPPASGPTGLILAGQQVPVSGPNPEATVDPELLSEMLAPLLEDQINPTPLVIELEIPSGNGAREADSLDRSDIQVPTGRSAAFPQIMLLPTATPTIDPFREVEAPAGIPRLEIVPAVGVKFTPTPTPPTPTPTPQPTALWSASGPAPGRLWSSFQPRPTEENDHFWIESPFADYAANRVPSPNYQFGSTAGGRYRPHHGVDISNPSGTPIEAGVVGEVVHAGKDDTALLGPYNNFYGKAVVIRLDQRLPVAGGQLDVYVLYGHMSEVLATVGQRVKPTDIVGRVGMTGIAIGPHLHVEVRLGANTYSHNVNPYLWLKPSPGKGAVAVRLLTADGRTWAGAKLSIARFEGGKAVWARQIETYLDTENIGPDPAWGENGAMGDVPAGRYYLIGRVNGESVRAEFPVVAGQTSFVEIRTQQ